MLWISGSHYSTTVDQIKENVKSTELELDPADVAMMRDMVEEIDK